MPRFTVLLSFPALLFALLVILTATGLTGSSTGMLHYFFSSEADPRLVAGQPQAIRGDEWSVQTTWTISQVQNGLPVQSPSFPGGFDTTVQSDLPSTDWSVAFRPHLWGFLFLPLDNAMALKWWLPGFAMMAAVYAFLVTLVPRRPLAAALLSAAFFYAPFFQWWYLPITFWPVAWAFAAMAAAQWMIRSPKVLHRLVWAAVVGYLTVTMTIGVYVPFIVPAVLVVAGFAVGLVFTADGPLTRRILWDHVRRVLPLLAAGLAAAAVMLVWMYTRRATIDRFLNTVYPGQRFGETGAGSFREVAVVLGAPMAEGMADTGGGPLAVNTSEAASFFLVGLFLAFPLLVLAARRWRSDRSVDGLTLAVVATLGVVLAFLFVPGWDPIAHAVLLDRTTRPRMRMALGILAMVITAVAMMRLSESARRGIRLPRRLSIVVAALCAASIVGVVLYLARRSEPLLVNNWEWIVVACLMIVSAYALSRGRAALPALCLLVVALIGSVGANPLYRGVYDLNQTDAMAVIKAEAAEEEGRWVGVGNTLLPNLMLVQSGLTAYNGFQGAPSPEMWSHIDPSGVHEEQWNRLASVSWDPGDGEPNPRNPHPDQIRMTFDSCERFAQTYVTHVLSDVRIEQPCLLEKHETKGVTPLFVYEVVGSLQDR